MLGEAAGAPGRAGAARLDRGAAGAPGPARWRRWPRLEPMLGAEARRGGAGLLGRAHPADDGPRLRAAGPAAPTRCAVLDRLEREIERRGTGVRYAGVPHTYRSWLLRNLGDPEAEELARTGLELAGSQEIRAQCHLDVADCLLRAGDLAGAAETGSAVAETESGARWFHNSWRFDQRRGLLLARLALAEHDAAAALDAAEPVAAAAEERGDARYAVLARLVRATAQARLGRAGRRVRLAADLDAARRRWPRSRAGGWPPTSPTRPARRTPGPRPRAAGRARGPRGGRARRGVPDGRRRAAGLTRSGDRDGLDHDRREPLAGPAHRLDRVGHEAPRARRRPAGSTNACRCGIAEPVAHHVGRARSARRRPAPR